MSPCGGLLSIGHRLMDLISHQEGLRLFILVGCGVVFVVETDSVLPIEALKRILARNFENSNNVSFNLIDLIRKQFSIGSLILIEIFK